MKPRTQAANQLHPLTEKIKVLDAQLARLVGETAPDMVARHGVGPRSATQLLINRRGQPDLLDAGSDRHANAPAHDRAVPAATRDA